MQVGQDEQSKRGRPQQGSGPHFRGAVGTGTRRRPRVMIVDDDDDTRELYAWAMRAAGWLVETVPDGKTAILQAASFAPDVIVMDLHLPVLDGYEATRRLRADDATHDIPVVVCTAFAGSRGGRVESGRGHDVRRETVRRRVHARASGTHRPRPRVTHEPHVPPCGVDD